MATRFLSMYYGSISRRRAVEALFDWVAGLWTSPDARRQDLADAVCEQIGKADVFAVGSARSALTACLRAAGIGPGDDVLLSSYTCLAVPTGVIAAGARPVYVDIDPRTLNADTDTVIAAMTDRVRAVVIQHTLGRVAPVAPIVAAARQRGILVIEDCALAVGSRGGGHDAGTQADAALFSMELSKTISCGWGGVLAVRELRLAAAMRDLYARLPQPGAWAATRDTWQTAISAWCHDPAWFHALGRYVLHVGFGVGLFRRSTPHVEYDGGTESDFLQRMSGPQAALAARQWRDLPAIAGACERNASTLRGVLQELGYETPGAPGTGDVAAAPRVSFLAADRARIMAYFLARGIELGEWFDGPLSPLPSSPVFNYDRDRYPHAAAVARHVVNLPCHSRLTAADVAAVASTLRAFTQQSPAIT